MKEIEKLNYRPFTKWCMSIGAIPSSYLAGLTIEEQLLWFCSYLEKEVIPTVNNNGEAVTELQNLYIELHDYVEHYFDNLDVQEEINNKLDDMAESGELTDIIAQYLNLAGVLSYPTVADMKIGNNLANGSTAKTLGFYNLNDGGGAIYKIRTITNEDVIDEKTIIALNDNTLVAELIYDVVNIKQFGAYGDGVHDDTLAIQTGIDKIKSVLYIPDGTYIVSPVAQYTILNYGTNIRPYYGIYINNKENITIKCDGVIIPDYSNNNMNIFAIQNSKNIMIDGLKAILTEAYTDHGSILQTRALININNSTNIQVTNCYAENIGSGCIMVASNDCSVENSKVTRTALTYITASLFGTYNCKGCIINNNTCYGGSNDGDLAIFGVSRECVASNNKLYSYLENDNTVNMTGSQALGIDSSCYNCIVSNNYIDFYYYGIDIKTSARENLIDGNIVENCKYGITSRLGEGNQITGDLTISNNIIMPNNGNGNTAVIKDTTSIAVGILISNTLSCNVCDNTIVPSLQTGTKTFNYIGILLSDMPTVDEGTAKLFKISGNQILQRNALGSSISYNTGRAIYIVGSESKNIVHVCLTDNNIKPAYGNLTDYSLYINYAKDVLISNNTFSNAIVSSGENGHIYINHSTLINISNNNMDIARHTLTAENSSDIIFNSNLFCAYGGYIACVVLNSVDRCFVENNYYKGKATNEGYIYNLTGCNYLNFSNNTFHTNRASIYNNNATSSTNITETNTLIWAVT